MKFAPKQKKKKENGNGLMQYLFLLGKEACECCIVN